MSGVAIGAHRRDDQTALEKAFAMTAHRVVVSIDVVAACKATGSGRTAGTMTPAAETRHFGWKGWRFRVESPSHPVSAMAVSTAGSVRIASFAEHPVRAGCESLNYLGVTNPAVNLGGDRGTGALQSRVSVSVALRAGLTAMNGVLKLNGINIQ
jgi:hypothetical protein